MAGSTNSPALRRCDPARRRCGLSGCEGCKWFGAEESAPRLRWRNGDRRLVRRMKVSAPFACDGYLRAQKYFSTIAAEIYRGHLSGKDF
jgi:hypothetical protein